MSVAVELDALWDHVRQFGDTPYLVTASAEARPHVVSVTVRIDGEVLRLPGGNTTRANVTANPTATLLWSAAPGGDYCLIVDGDAVAAENDELVITPTRAVLHRVAGASQDLASCVRIVPGT